MSFYLLGSSKAALIHAVVDGIIHHCVDGVNLGQVRGGRQVQSGVGGKGVELRVEHSENLRGLVVDDAARQLIPQHRYRVLAQLIFTGLVQVADKSVSQRIGGALWDHECSVARGARDGRASRRVVEKPSAVCVSGVVGPGTRPGGVHDGTADDILESL